MTGPLSDRPASAFGPEVRLHAGSIEVRRGVGARLVELVAAVALGVAGALLLPVQVAVGVVVMVACVVPVVRLVRASTWARLASRAGWVDGGDTLPWELVTGLVLHRTSAEAATIVAATGEHLPVALRVPARDALRERRIAEDVVARHLHQLAHLAGRAPVPTTVDLGPERPAVAFDARCARCAAAG